MPTAAPASDAPAAGLPQHVLGYRALKLWQRALDLAADAHRLAGAFPNPDQPALAADLRRAAAAVPAAVAASALAFDRADQQRALQAATGALARVETLVALAERTGGLAPADATALLFTSGDVHRLLRGFVRSVAARTAGRSAEVAGGAAPAGVHDASSREPAVARVAEPVGAGAAAGVGAAAGRVGGPPSMRPAASRRRRSAARSAPPAGAGGADEAPG